MRPHRTPFHRRFISDGCDSSHDIAGFTLAFGDSIYQLKPNQAPNIIKLSDTKALTEAQSLAVDGASGMRLRRYDANDSQALFPRHPVRPPIHSMAFIPIYISSDSPLGRASHPEPSGITQRGWEQGGGRVLPACGTAKTMNRHGPD